ncbi:nucleotidyltransferase domain-containing protein [Leptospira sp. 96542]|nr:nucleotidyltransferase domain-containing protein [Leptospira sp. 96542]
MLNCLGSGILLATEWTQRSNKDVNQENIHKQMIPRVLELCKNSYGQNLIGLVLYGSVARGTEHNRSDVDLLVVLESVPEIRFELTDFFIRNIEDPVLSE